MNNSIVKSNGFAHFANVCSVSLLRGLGLLLVLVALSCIPAFAQSNSSITGVVTDQSGARIPNAVVSLTNSQSGFSQDAKTDDQGTYKFDFIPPAENYLLTFTKDGFRSVSIANVTLSASTKETRDAKLELGDTKQTVEVTASTGDTLNTTDAAIGNTINAERVADLPSLFRTNVINLLQLEPGVETTGSDAQQGAVTGTRADQANITLDGLDVNDQRLGGAFTTVGNIPIDSIEEFHATVLGNDSSTGRSAGAQVDLVTKSGTNDWHGSLSEYHRNTDFAANDYFNNLAGVPEPPLLRNQFGGDLGGPIIKNKLFFFFDYLALRQTQSQQIQDVVPLTALRNGELNYVNNGAGCSSASTIATAPGCISTLTSAQITALDPGMIGPDPNIVSLLNSRYPMSNTSSFGDGVNTGGFTFTLPLKNNDNTFVGRLDYNITPNQRLFARANWDRNSDGNTNTGLFPGDPAPLFSVVSHQRSFVVGHTWTISPTLTNQAAFGITRQVLDFANEFQPTAPFNFNLGTALTSPFPRFDGGQGANNPVPEARDTISWVRGKHTLQFGGDIKPIRIENLLQNSAGFYSIGIGGEVNSLGAPVTGGGTPNPLRPNDIYGTGQAIVPSDASLVDAEYDNLFPTLLGRYASVLTRVNYNAAGNPFPLGNFQTTNFHYNQFEFFGQDVWNVRRDLTVTYGLRWQYHSVPYEANGIEAVPNINAEQLLGARIAAANQGVNGSFAVPLVNFSLGGPANNGPNYYQPSYTDFAPRLGLAYAPSFTDGILGKLFGDRKTSIRMGAGVNYDNQEATESFEFSQQTFLFANQFQGNFGGSDPATALATSPRFQGFTTGLPPVVPPGVIPHGVPFTPNLDSNGNPVGLAEFGATFFQLNNNLKTPYEISYSLGIQRELPGNFIVDINYVGKLGRRLFAVGDAAQQINFLDPASGQKLYTAFGSVQKQLEQGINPSLVTAQPFFENQINKSPVIQSFGPGATCESLAHMSCTAIAASSEANGPWTNGDVSTVDLDLEQLGLLQPNTGLLAQTGAAGYYGNFSASSYNALIVTVRKRLTHSLTFDVNYAFAHSLDNVSDIQNEANQFTGTGAAEVCDLRNLRICKGSSNFDARQTTSADFLYTLPIGHGQAFLNNTPKWVDEIVGGWKTSGIITYHTGFPYFTTTGTFPIDFTQDAPPVFVGPSSAVSHGLHVSSGQVQFLSNPTNALGAFQFPFGGDVGSRNVLRGPGYSNVDMAVLKDFSMPWSDRQKLEFRAEAFNLFNHENFGDPSGAIESPSTFGLIASSALTPSGYVARQLQLALKFSF